MQWTSTINGLIFTVLEIGAGLMIIIVAVILMILLILGGVLYARAKGKFCFAGKYLKFYLDFRLCRPTVGIKISVDWNHNIIICWIQ